jgi:hypothetical protein
VRTIDPGHFYELDELDRGDQLPSDVKPTLCFVKRVGEAYPGNTGEPYPGVTSQEVLRALISRAKYVDWQQPCKQNEAVIGFLRAAMWELEDRAAEAAGYEFEDAAIRAGLEPSPTAAIELWPKCQTCGHLACERDHGAAR